MATDSRESSILSILSSPDYRTVTSVNSVSDRSDKPVNSAYVFGPKIGLVAVFYSPFKKRQINSFHFCCIVGASDYVHFRMKNSTGTRL